MKTLIFSDVHLNVAEDGREKMGEFVDFLRGIDTREVDRIIILGDLFDFWFEYRHVIFSGYFDVLRAFAGLRDQGVCFHFVCGNHDLWAGRFLRERLGFAIHPDSVELDLSGRRCLFIHGDGINLRDWSYRIYKKIARLRWVAGLFRLLHPDWAMALGQVISRGSRRMSARPDTTKGPEVEPLRRFAEEMLARGKADVVLCGHSHYPVIEEYPTPGGAGEYINTGDWLFHHSYVEWDGANFQLLRYGADPVVVAGGKARRAG